MRSNRMIQISLRQEKGPSSTKQDVRQKKGIEHLDRVGWRQQVCRLPLTLLSVSTKGRE